MFKRPAEIGETTTKVAGAALAIRRGNDVSRRHGNEFITFAPDEADEKDVQANGAARAPSHFATPMGDDEGERDDVCFEKKHNSERR